MTRQITLVVRLSLLLLGIGLAETDAGESPDSTRQFMFMAVLEGLYVDGVSNETIDLIIPAKAGFREHFIYGCPMCMPTYDAMVLYRSRDGFYGMKPPESPPDTFGPGLSDEIKTQLASSNKETRLMAIESLVRRWVDRRIDLMNLDEVKQAHLLAVLEEGSMKGGEALERHRDAGTYGIEATREFCAVCRAASRRAETSDLGRATP